jgi:predicted metal-dependent phosphoesterase TrpH
MIDLHSHTTASDGTTAPADLIAEAKAAGIGLLAITDHDTFDGWQQARSFAVAESLPLIPGVELSTTLDPEGKAFLPGFRADVHLLAYFPAGEPPPAFQQWVGSLLESRWERNRMLLRRLADKGLSVDEATLRARGGPVAGRVHLARLLRDLGHVASIDEAFRHFFGESAADYVPRRCPPLVETIARVREAGGIASLAHPIRFWGEHREAGAQLCGWLASHGLHALEVWHSEQSPEYSAWLHSLAARHGLGCTGGSDFHGLNKPGIFLGVGRGRQPLVPLSAASFAASGEAPLPLPVSLTLDESLP